jgi:hypothetical protein
MEVTRPPATAGEVFQTNMYNYGLHTPSRRFLCGSCAVAAGLLIVRPGFCFDEDGCMRKPKLLCPKDPEATNYHFFLAPLVTGLAFCTLC